MSEPSQEDIKKLSLEDQAYIASLDGLARDKVARLLVAAFDRGAKEEAERMRKKSDEILEGTLGHRTLFRADLLPRIRSAPFVRPVGAGAVSRLPNELVDRIFMLLVHDGHVLQDVLHEHLDHCHHKSNKLERRGMCNFAGTCFQWRAIVQSYRDKYLSISLYSDSLSLRGHTRPHVEHLNARSPRDQRLRQPEIDRLLKAIAVHGEVLSYLSLDRGCSALVGLLADTLPGGRAQLKGISLDRLSSKCADLDMVLAAIPSLTSLRDFRLSISMTAEGDAATFSQKALSALAALPYLASIDISGSTLESLGASPLVAIPAFASTSLRHLRLSYIPGIDRGCALSIASGSAPTLESLVLLLRQGADAIPSLSPSPPVQFPNLQQIEVFDMTMFTTPWTEVPELAGLLERSPLLVTIVLRPACFNDHGRGRVSPTQRFKDKISNGVVQKVELKGSRRCQPAEFLHFIDNSEWPSTVEVVHKMK